MSNSLQITLYQSDLLKINNLKQIYPEIKNCSTNQIVRFMIHDYTKKSNQNVNDLIIYSQKNVNLDLLKINFSNQFSCWRKEHNYSLNETAKLLKVSKATIFKWERGTIPSYNHLKKIEKVCNINILNLI